MEISFFLVSLSLYGSLNLFCSYGTFSLMSSSRHFDGNKVMMDNDTYCMVRGMGKFIIENEDGSVVTLSNVRYIPEMGRKLI